MDLVLHHLKARHAPHPQRYVWWNSCFGIWKNPWKKCVKIWDLTISEYVYHMYVPGCSKECRAEWMIRGAYTVSFRIKQHPLEDARILTWNLFTSSILDYRIFKKYHVCCCWQPNLPTKPNLPGANFCILKTKELSEGLGDTAASGPTNRPQNSARFSPRDERGWQLVSWKIP